ncbi:hypothetical protein C8P63_1467 [Melghirimyces profundicolus]|uniref:Uncharacterized protein n=2 Tax=Melghirimyces profundicolus TaxID=1242148 RepID=A0A2T6AWX4_9BACL|nr:hypothetical protein C8P63_1467 [Melghirimyces profundicolus]
MALIEASRDLPEKWRNNPNLLDALDKLHELRIKHNNETGKSL